MTKAFPVTPTSYSSRRSALKDLSSSSRTATGVLMTVTWSDLKAVILRSDRHGSTHELDQVPSGDVKPRVQSLKRLESLSSPSQDATEVLMNVTWSDLKGYHLPV